MTDAQKCTVHTLDHLVLTVADIPTSLDFYARVLGMTAKAFDAADGSQRWALIFGQSKINLHQSGREFDPKARQAQPGSADLCFLTDVPLVRWQAHLASETLAIEEGPVARSGATGPITSLYIRDPDGNLIEISTRNG
ncbi:biphenyl-2,3-diol 1,2-dioxygenase [Roseobacter cerasinus]|uniref:Biphenyl-2,3-diol 1,2-dioxygenase n=1 Tax=Roseobacter cerasinus TaxID=2602289 RepID=A0A640VKI3_9RHOB|nr:VOC family protein [Roseobacter cerasinus]GFE48948.1 biphenyl-2,3-diol 1,2-dioxygenase [Roseobacter cerasinus]